MPCTRAAIYVRMSTEHQQYSIENQTAAMEAYAEKHGMDIVKTYADGGRSGLSLRGRAGLQALIADTQTGTPEFTDILVLDVSRWGRFQDPDEAGHYEFICRKAGYRLHYVNEQFDNDGGISGTLMKGVKRVMAGSYSHELSNKVFAGQCRLIEKGFKQGGPAGYGLRRMLINEKGEEKGLLKRGEHKSLTTDRVILVPGPPEEIEIVHWIYRCFVEDGRTEGEIAGLLNRRGIETDLDRDWTRVTVRQVLTNEKYIGNNVFNRRSFKLKERMVENPPDKWIRVEGAFQGIVPREIFTEAQSIIKARRRKWTIDDMLLCLKTLHAAQGRLSCAIIDGMEGIPTSTAYRSRFGSLLAAYEIIGYVPDHDFRFVEINRHLRQFREEMVKGIIDGISESGGLAQIEPDSGVIVVNGEVRLLIIVGRCRKTAAGSLRWRIQAGLKDADLTLFVRMDESNKNPVDYFLLPSLDMETGEIRLQEENGLEFDAYRLGGLVSCFRYFNRTPVREEF